MPHELAGGKKLTDVKGDVDSLLSDLKIVQVVHTTTGNSITTTSDIDLDDTIPQNTEGAAINDLDTVITPKDTNNSLLVIAVIMMGPQGNGGPVTCALFKDSDADALTASGDSAEAARICVVPMMYRLVSPIGVSAITFKVRFGGAAGTTTRFNGTGGGGARVFSTMEKSSVTVFEIAP